MSEKFTGVTFAKQKVTPSDDAIIRRAILPDGILTGCVLSYSGSTLTMAAGHLMICGRQIRMPSVQNWAVVDATSGYARLVLTIDLTRTATKTTFEQVVDSIEYASAENGFADLEQADINLTGTRYQVAACVVSLGTGGITGIVSKLEKCEVGAGLNFNVVGGLTQPSNPKENTIWVNTDQKITSWIFSAEAPAEPEEGMVWFATGASSQVAFNALKKNTVMVYPISAKQYVSGIWIDTTAKSYQNGKWVDWLFYLFKEGTGFAQGYTGFSNAAFTNDLLTMTIKTTGNTKYSTSNETVDVTDYKTAVFEIQKCSYSGASGYNQSVHLYVGESSVQVGKTISGNSGTFATDETIKIDISALSGEASIKASAKSSDSDTVIFVILIKNIYFE